MRKTVKYIALSLCLLLAVSVFSGCGASKADLIMVTDSLGIADGSFNQGAWSGLVQYAEQKGISHTSIKAKEDTTEAYLSAIEKAVKSGALIIVLPGNNFDEAAGIAQEQYPEVNFVLVDGRPKDASGNVLPNSINTVSLIFTEEQAGFLAGYAAVQDGYTRLGFMGGVADDEAVQRYGYGYVQGAEYAAQQLGAPAGSIQISYLCTGTYAESDAVKELADALILNDHTEVIFAACGAAGKSVMLSAEEQGTKVIGVDVDQSATSESVIITALKGLDTAVYSAIEAYYNAEFHGGEVITLSTKENGVGLSMDTSRMRTFNQEMYDNLFAALQNNTGNLTAGIITNDTTVDALPLSCVALHLYEGAQGPLMHSGETAPQESVPVSSEVTIGGSDVVADSAAADSMVDGSSEADSTVDSSSAAA